MNIYEEVKKEYENMEEGKLSLRDLIYRLEELRSHELRESIYLWEEESQKIKKSMGKIII